MIILYDGDVKKLSKATGMLTWYEKCFLGLEMLFGETTPTSKSAGAAFGLIQGSTAPQIFDNTLDKILKTRDRWPMYAFKSEDEQLRQRKWDAKYGEDK